MVDMVNLEVSGRVEDFSMHPKQFFGVWLSSFSPAGGIKGAICPVSVPLVLAQVVVIFRVHYGVFAAC